MSARLCEAVAQALLSGPAAAPELRCVLHDGIIVTWVGACTRSPDACPDSDAPATDPGTAETTRYIVFGGGTRGDKNHTQADSSQQTDFVSPLSTTLNSARESGHPVRCHPP